MPKALQTWLDILKKKTRAYVFYDKLLKGTSPLYPDTGVVEWGEFCLMIPNIICAATSELPLSGLYLQHGSHFGNAVNVCADGMVRGSYDKRYHEFVSNNAGVYCNPFASPDLEGDVYKASAHQFAMHCHMRIEGEPV